MIGALGVLDYSAHAEYIYVESVVFLLCAYAKTATQHISTIRTCTKAKTKVICTKSRPDL